MGKQTVECACGQVLAKGEIKNGDYLPYRPCKKKPCRDASVFIITDLSGS